MLKIHHTNWFLLSSPIQRNLKAVTPLNHPFRFLHLKTVTFSKQAMAEVVAIVASLMTVLDSRAARKVVSMFGVRKDLERLKTILEDTVKPVLQDAEEQQLNNHEIRAWLRRLKDASCDADDILDDFKVEALRQNIRIQHHGSSVKKVLRFTFSLCSVVFRVRMSRRIKEVRQKFDEIAEDRHKFHLTEKSTIDRRVLDEDRRQTISFVDERQVFGREEDKDGIVKLLLDIEEGQDVSVLAIRGMGGLGKTTLAQFVYNDERVSAHFNSKMWVYVGQHFDVQKITGKVFASAVDSKAPKFEMEQLQSRLRQQLQGKRFLLVLDDVWNENDNKWDELKGLLTCGAKGSKVLVTTRSGKAAAISGAISTHILKGLSEDDCWELFRQRAFARGQEEANPNLVVIGKEIVKKCGGVPLAAKSLGSLMRFKTEEHEWASVKDNDILQLRDENDILPALRISYNDLPFDVKRCFAYCCFMEKGDGVSKKFLIQMWIAEGFIVHLSGDYQRLYETGEEYMKELHWRSFFDIKDNEIKMHDLIQDLARDVAAGIGSFVWEKEALVLNPRQVRHVTFANLSDSISPEYPISLRGLSNLRTLLYPPKSLVNSFFSHLRCLRVLVVNLNSRDFPSSIGKLKHLRYLDISSWYIQTLPKSVSKLHCLEVLRLECPKLIELPSDIEKMVNLRCIDLGYGAPLSHMPSGLGNLTNLRELSLFVVGNGIGCKLNDLHGLIHLGGRMIIKNLQNMSSATESAKANLREKKILELRLLWNEEDNSHGHVRGNETHAAVLETLQPHQNIEALEINGYRGAEFPRWLMEPSFPKIVSIKLDKCVKCEHLPPFWKLPSLKELVLWNMDALRSMESNGAERGQQVWFPKLVKLQLKGVPNLESLTPRAATAAANNSIGLVSFPCLEGLRLEICNEKLVHSLLVVGNNNQISFSSLTKLRYLKIWHCNDLEALPENALQSSTSLEDLSLLNCPNLVIHQNILSMECFTSLEELKFLRLPKLVSLPEGIQNAAKLHTFRIEECEGLMSLPDWMGNLTSLRELVITVCPQLKFLPDGIHQLTALEDLMIHECTGLTSWPNWLWSFTSLRCIAISCASNLPSLPQQFQNLTCLRILRIGAYNVLTSLPDWMVNLTWIQELWLSNCGEHLTSRCQKDTGEDWPKISHIPKIQINYQTIQDK